MKKAWALISIHVRKSACINGTEYLQCYTCRKITHWKEANCSHFLHNKLDLDLRNLKACCVRCNQWLSGNLGVYAERLIREHGLDWMKQLRHDATEKGNNYSREELLEIIEQYVDYK